DMKVMSGTAGFPTKEDSAPNEPGHCDDGDMALFNGLLCAVEEQQGCEGVKRAKGDSGQWFRSPAIMKRGEDNVDQSNLNADQSKGVMLYVLQERDTARFQDWMEWVKQQNSVPPRFCSIATEKCHFRLDSCSLLTLTGHLLGVQDATEAV